MPGPALTAPRYAAAVTDRGAADTRWIRDGAREVRRGPGGDVDAELIWDGGRLAAARVAGHGDAGLDVDGAVVAHPVLGPSHPLRVDGAAVAVMSAVDWARPTRIPAIDRPGALPPGTGTMLLDVLARLAARAGVTALRYAGPYPTAALWDALGASFRTAGTLAAFTADAAARWGGGALPEVPIDFAPAPHHRVRAAADVIAVVRDGVERAVIAGAGFARDGGVRRLVDDGEVVAAELWFGDRRWARVATLDGAGALRDRPARPPADGPPAGQVIPAELIAALVELIDELLPAPLTADALRAVPVVWGDAGLAAAADRGDRVVVHVGLWQHLAPHGLARVAAALAEALAPIAQRRAVAALTAA